MGLWKRRDRVEVADFDVLLLMFAAQLIDARASRGLEDPDWISLDAVAELVEASLEGARDQLDVGWDAGAERRGLVERDCAHGQTRIRLTRAARQIVRP